MILKVVVQAAPFAIMLPRDSGFCDGEEETIE